MSFGQVGCIRRAEAHAYPFQTGPSSKLRNAALPASLPVWGELPPEAGMCVRGRELARIQRHPGCAVGRDSSTHERGYRIRFAHDGYRIISAEGREVWRIIILRKRDWLRGLHRA
jgi:hypothetical protein